MQTTSLSECIWVSVLISSIDINVDKTKLISLHNIGYVHGLIHLNFAVEFKQPLLLAEAFAQACVHNDTWYTEYLTAAEAMAATSTESPLPLSACFDLERADPVVSSSSSYYYHSQRRPSSGKWAADVEQARDGILVKAKSEICRIAARYRVDPNDLDRATAELINTAGESALFENVIEGLLFEHC